jgi:hypothetical protein
MNSIVNKALLNVFGPLILAGAMAANVAAHIMTDTTQFPDMKASDARFDVMVLVAAGIIPEKGPFGADEPLMHQDLAVWSALALGLQNKTGEQAGTAELARRALEQGLVTSLEGQATYAEIDTVLFQGGFAHEHPDEVPSRGAAAAYIVAGLADAAGTPLMEKLSLQYGPIGKVTSVESRKNPDGGSSVYITVAGTALPVYVHGRVGNGPADLKQWQGRTVRRSLIRKQGEFAVWLYLEAEAGAAGAGESTEHGQHVH